jgi:MinD-like ATPase involved in chromosome partitioning or flagellar assembly
LDDKKQPPKGQPAATKAAAAPRHRFAEGETTIMPLADILRSRDSKALSDPGLSGTLPVGWSGAKGELVAAMAEAPRDDITDKDDATQIASGFEGLRTVIRPAPLSGPAKSVASGTGAGTRSDVQSKERTSPGLKARGEVPPPVVPPPVVPPPVVPPPDVAQRPATLVNSGGTVASEGMGQGKGKAKVRNQVIVFFSCKGGSGATALSVNAAHTYARDKLSCCLVDMDLQLGDALAALALKPKVTLAQAAVGAAAGDRIERERLPQHHSGVAVLSQVGSLDVLDTVSSENMATLVEDLRETFDVIVLDGVREFSDNVLAVLDVADKICIVTVQEVLSIRRARWSFNILRKIGFDPKDITIVLNRFDVRSEVPVASVRAMFEPATTLTVAADPLPVLQSLNRGVPLQDASPNKPVTRQMSRLANSLIGHAVSEDLEDEAMPEASVIKRMLKRFK